MLIRQIEFSEGQSFKGSTSPPTTTINAGTLSSAAIIQTFELLKL